MEIIAKTERYRVAVSIDKDRLYLTGYGDITSISESEPSIDDVKTAIARLKPGYTCLADFREVWLMTMTDITVVVQKTMLETGLSKIASVWGEQLLARMTVRKTVDGVHSVAGAYKTRRKEFDNMADAEAWLDQPTDSCANKKVL